MSLRRLSPLALALLLAACHAAPDDTSHPDDNDIDNETLPEDTMSEDDPILEESDPSPEEMLSDGPTDPLPDDDIGPPVHLEKWTRMATDAPFRYGGRQSVAAIGRALYAVSLDDVYGSLDGIVWDIVTANAPFTHRTDHATAVFDDRLFVIGGERNVELDDAWYSEDGLFWQRSCGPCPFGERTDPSAVEFNGSLWVIGGRWRSSTYSYQHPTDIWRTTDGTNWERAVEEAPFGPLDGQSLAVHDGLLWLFAAPPDETYENALWRSADGVNWEKLNVTLPFAPRQRTLFFSWNGILRVVGGQAEDGTYLSDAWASPDGVSWQEEAVPDTFVPRYGAVPVATDDALLLIGGRSVEQWFFGENDVWGTDGGGTWTERWRPGSFPNRFNHTVNFFRDRFWIIAGRTRYTGDNDVYLADIYSSTDGAEWEPESLAAPFGKRQDHASIVFKDKLWLVGGDIPYGEELNGDVWSSENGTDWQMAVSTAPFGHRFGMRLFVLNDHLFLAGGSNIDSLDEYGDIWRSPDGIAWQKVAGGLPFLYCDNEFTVHEGAVYALGGCTWHNTGNEVWKSENGIAWHQIKTVAPFTPRREHAVVSLGGFLWVIGGADSDDLNDVWYSSDGRSWRQAENADFLPRACHASMVHNDRIWVLGGFEYARNAFDFGDVWTTGITEERP